MIIAGTPAMAACDGCGEQQEAVETRNPKTGALTAAFLPRGWRLDRLHGEEVHRCALCLLGAVEPFEERRAAFDARLDHHGTALLPVIAESVGVPIGIATRWAAEWDNQQRNVA